MKLQTAMRVIVCDGGRYVIYENHGDADMIDLRVKDTGNLENPATREQGTDRPGRYPSPDGQRSAVGQTDWHDQAESRFATSIAGKIADWTGENKSNSFVLVADPRMMGHLRKELPQPVAAKMLTAVTGDFVRQPVSVIEALIKAQ